LTCSAKDSHQIAIEKEKRQQQLRKAFNISDSYKIGSVFGSALVLLLTLRHQRGPEGEAQALV